MTQPHTCPDCRCEPLCDVCYGMGFVTEWHPSDPRPQVVGIGLPFDHPIWDSLGSGGYTSKPCPRGCAAPAMYYGFTTRTAANT